MTTAQNTTSNPIAEISYDLMLVVARNIAMLAQTNPAAAKKEMDGRIADLNEQTKQDFKRMITVAAATLAE